jgi:addiction module RelE/StbE family toxin
LLKYRVQLSENVQRKFSKLPKNIQELLENWVDIIQDGGLTKMQQVASFRDHSLKGKLSGLRSSSLNRSYRVIYKVINDSEIYIYVLEVNKHDYKKIRISF